MSRELSLDIPQASGDAPAEGMLTIAAGATPRAPESSNSRPSLVYTAETDSRQRTNETETRDQETEALLCSHLSAPPPAPRSTGRVVLKIVMSQQYTTQHGYPKHTAANSSSYPLFSARYIHTVKIHTYCTDSRAESA